jgi:anti-anti-sigma regulatory factor
MDAAESGDFVIVDLTKVEYIDDSGLYALEAGLRESRELGRDFIMIAAPRSAVRRALESAGFAPSAGMHDSLNRVLASVRMGSFAAASA